MAFAEIGSAINGGVRTRKRGTLFVILCSSSSYGRVICTYEKDNLRFFTYAKGFCAMEEEIQERTASERSFKRKKIDYCLKPPELEAQRCGSSAALSSPCVSILMLGLLMRKWISRRLFKDGLGKAR